MRKIILMLILAFVSSNAMADTLNYQPCDFSGAMFAQCAATWERVFHNANVMANDTDLWQTASFQSFIDGVAFVTLNKKWCAKKLVPLDNIYAIVAKFVRENPEQWDSTPSYLILKPLAKLFPCSKK